MMCFSVLKNTCRMCKTTSRAPFRSGSQGNWIALELFFSPKVEPKETDPWDNLGMVPLLHPKC